MNIHDAMKISKKCAASLNGLHRSLKAIVEQPKHLPIWSWYYDRAKNYKKYTRQQLHYRHLEGCVLSNKCAGIVRCYIFELNRSKNSPNRKFLGCTTIPFSARYWVLKKLARFWPVDIYMDCYQSCKEIHKWPIFIGCKWICIFDSINLITLFIVDTTFKAHFTLLCD
jgi:hypothetical protein